MPSPIGNSQFDTIADLRTVSAVNKTKVDVLGLQTLGDNNGGIYMWDSTSTATDDGFLTIQVTGVTTGRWKRVSNSNTLKGTVNISAISLQNVYIVSYPGGALPFTPSQVYTEARSANASGNRWISNITSSGFTINFISVPALGTMVVDYLVIKQ